MFVSFPHLNLIRKLKARLHLYPKWDNDKNKLDFFYQFALDRKKVKEDLEKIGLKFKENKNYDGIKGLKDELPFFRKSLQTIYTSNNIVLKIIKRIISILVNPICSHSCIMVFIKK